MDVSKLPRMSQTPPPAAGAQQPNDPPQPHQRPAPPQRLFAEAWISIAIGLLLLVFLPHFSKLWQYTFSRAEFDATWTFRDRAGNAIPYSQSAYFREDIAVTSFALMLIVEGMVLVFLRRRAVVGAAFAVTVGVVLLNLAVLLMVRPEIGFRLMPALAVVFGVYIAMYQWRLLVETRAASE